MSKFKPCPGCGYIPGGPSTFVDTDGFNYYRVVCNCGWSSPSFKSDINHAIELWNKRYSSNSPTVIRNTNAIPKSERLLTFDEWKAEGYYVTKGSKSCGRNEQGKPVFRERDVSKMNRKYGATEIEDEDPYADEAYDYRSYQDD